MVANGELGATGEDDNGSSFVGAEARGGLRQWRARWPEARQRMHFSGITTDSHSMTSCEALETAAGDPLFEEASQLLRPLCI
jgi:hypothetical protein